VALHSIGDGLVVIFYIFLHNKFIGLNSMRLRLQRSFDLRQSYFASSRKHLVLCTLTLAIFAHATTVSHGQNFTVNAETCKPYRQGPLTSRKIALLGRNTDERIIRWQTLYYRPEYVRFPETPRPVDAPLTSEIFLLDSSTGQPVPPNLVYKPGSARTATRLSIELGTNHGMSLHETLSIYAKNARNERVPFRVDQLKPQPGNYPNGTYFKTGEDFYGYSRIQLVEKIWTDDLGIRHDSFIEQDASMKLVSFLRCDAVGSVPNPGCELFEYFDDLRLKARSFRRNEMPNIEKIKNHARMFTKCLLLKGD
jgi:hypothetical protein